METTTGIQMNTFAIRFLNVKAQFRICDSLTRSSWMTTKMQKEAVVSYESYFCQFYNV